ncbi:hypothetical protein [Streptomyces sp. NPDC059918]|uniref:hypothetical protein n=1 Tax=unclassified Streptomyces TaxID=2593676 RepID=UPI00365F7181
MSAPTPPAGALRVDLAPHRNNAAFLAAGTAPGDGFDGFGRAYPAEELGAVAALLDMPADLGRGVPDNIACEGQVLTLDFPVRAGGIQVVGAGSGGTVSETVRLHADAGGAPGTAVDARVELSDFLSRRPVFDDRCFAHSRYLYDVGARPEHGAEPRLWASTVRFPEPVHCVRVTLPVNPDLHVMGLWLLPAGDR